MFGGYFLSIVFMSLFVINLEFLFGYTNIEVTEKEQRTQRIDSEC